MAGVGDSSRPGGLDPVCVCVGDPAAALRLTSQLICLGADVSLRSRWTNMNALHYAAYFDVPELIRVLLKAAKPRGRSRPGRHQIRGGSVWRIQVCVVTPQC